MRDNAKIVGDEKDSHAEFGNKVLHQVDDLGLNSDVERRCRLVGDQELGFGRKRHGDHGTLAHAAGKLEGILSKTRRRVGNADPLKHLNGEVAGLLLVHVAVQQELFHHLIADCDGRRKARHGLLENHGNRPTAHDLQIAVGFQAEDIKVFAVGGQGNPAFRRIDRVAGI